MTEEKRPFSYPSEDARTSDASSISELTPQPVLELEGHDAPDSPYTTDAPAAGTSAPAHFAEPAPGEAFEAAHLAQPDAPADSAPEAPVADAPAHAAPDWQLPHYPDDEGPTPDDDYLGNQDTGPLPDPADIAAAEAAAATAAAAEAASADTLEPGDTAEIDVTQVEAKLKDPGTTQSFAPITGDRVATDSTYDAGTTTTLMWGARSDVGCVRAHNEDSYLVASPLFAVCDGMGGHAAGEVASSIAVETIAKAAPATADATALAAAVEAANAAIIEAAAAGIGRPGMGCTATVAYIQDNIVAIAHVGDSRAYLLHDGVLTRITRDHSYVEELVDAGEITADEARVHPNRSVITRALGSDPSMYADHFQLNIDEGDRLILCSDGLSSMIQDNDIEQIAVQSSTAQMCTDNLVDAALAAGGADNVSVVVVDLVEDVRLRQVVRTHRRNLIIALAAIAVGLALCAAFLAFTIGNSVYLGVYGDTVAVYRGIPARVLGIDLHAVEEETSIELSDLPEDTRNRLAEGISQSSLDEAWATLSDYRNQITEAKEAQAANAEAIRESAEDVDEAGADRSDPPDTDSRQSNPESSQTPQTQTQEGGA